MHKIANDEFRVALTLQLFRHQKCIIPTRVRCAIPLDCNGIHVTTGCIKGGNSIHNHDRVKDQTAKILSYCGLSTKVEEQNAFRVYDEDNGKRPDITVFNHPDHAGKFFLDVRISSPVPATHHPSSKEEVPRWKQGLQWEGKQLQACTRSRSRIPTYYFRDNWSNASWNSTLLRHLPGTSLRSSEIYGRRFKETYETSRGAVRDFGYINIM